MYLRKLKTFLQKVFMQIGQYVTDFRGENKFTFADLCKCLPSVQVVNISGVYIEVIHT